ncbi:MAG: homoserine O-succinyltransferase [Rhodothermales bacterium]|jgi:homoserine O-succinyltransferase
MATSPIRIAVIDLYDRFPNEGMRAIRELLATNEVLAGPAGFHVEYFETRFDGSIPDLSFDAYISTGGPGSPFDGQGKPWETAYFHWLDALRDHNARGAETPRSVFFICHSFQMMVRHFGLGSVIPRSSRSFGIFPVHPTAAGLRDPLFEGLGSPFYAADFRDWQVVQPNHDRLDELGGSLLALEKKRDYVPLERAIMAMRVSPHLVGVQFHPEADPPGMGRHFRKPDLEDKIVMDHGREKYDRIIRRLDDPAFLKRTHDAVIPRFLRDAIGKARPELIPA